MIHEKHDYFLAIAKEGSITKASKSLYVSQPLLSKYLKALENEIGCKLFDRSSSPLKLTHAGERFLLYINDLQTLDNRFHKEMMEIGAFTRGTIVFGISVWRASITLPSILPLFWDKYPNIKIRIREGSHQQMAQWIKNNEVEFCLMHMPHSFQETKNEVILKEEILIAVHKNNPILKHAVYNPNSINSRFLKISASDLAVQDYIMLKEGQNLTTYVYAFFNKHGINPNCIFETQNIATAVSLVNQGIGLTFIPSCGVPSLQMHNNIVFLSINEDPLVWDICLTYKSSSYITHQARTLMNHIKFCLNNLDLS